MKTSTYTKIKHKGTTFFYKKKHEKQFENVKKALAIIKIVDESIYKEVFKIKYIPLADTKYYATAMTNRDINYAIISLKLIKASCLASLGATLIHEARHLAQSNKTYNDPYWAEMDATKAELNFFKKFNSTTLYNWIHPESGLKEYFDTLKKLKKR